MHIWVVAIGTIAAAIWPFANFLNANFSQLAIGAYGPLSDLVGLLTALCLVPIFVAAFSPARARSTAGRILTVGTIAITAIFLSRWAKAGVEAVGFEPGAALAVTGLLVVCLVALGWLLARYEPFRFAVACLGIAALTMPLGSVVSAWAALPTSTPTRGDANADAPSDVSMSGRNLYFLVVDGYGRADALADAGFDNSRFLQELADRGFFVDAQALGNYSSTHVSIMSMLEANYVVDGASSRYTDRAKFYPTALNNGHAPYVVEQFKSTGYHTVRISNEWGRCDESIFDRCFIEGGEELSYPMRSFFEATVLPELFPSFAAPPLSAPANDAVEIASQRFFEVTSEQPMFLFAHGLAPHAPFRYGAECRERLPQPDDESTADIARPLYLQMLPCVNANLLTLLDRIIAADPGGLIILVSDHGTDFQVDWQQRLEEWPTSAQQERFSILSASRFPDECAYHKPGMGQINLMRAALACLVGRQPSLLPERSFITVYENSSEFGRVLEAQLPR